MNLKIKDMKHLSVLICMGFALLWGIPKANAAVITVTSNADAGAGSFRAAVTAAADGDVIYFSGDMTIQFLTEVAISKSLTINARPWNVVFDGGAVNADGTASDLGTRLLKVSASGKNVVIKGITLLNSSCKCNFIVRQKWIKYFERCHKVQFFSWSVV